MACQLFGCSIKVIRGQGHITKYGQNQILSQKSPILLQNHTNNNNEYVFEN